MEEKELWALATLLIEAHGNKVAEFVLGQVQAMVDSGNEEGLADWTSVAGKVMDLLEPDGAQSLH